MGLGSEDVVDGVKQVQKLRAGAIPTERALLYNFQARVGRKH